MVQKTILSRTLSNEVLLIHIYTTLYHIIRTSQKILHQSHFNPFFNCVLQHVAKTNKVHENAPVWNFTLIWEGSYSFLLHIVQAFGGTRHLIDSNMRGTNVTEDVIKCIKWNENMKQFLFFDVVVMNFNLLIVQPLSLTFSIHIVTYYTCIYYVTLINETNKLS